MSDAPIVEVTRDEIRYRASALGGCQKALVAARLGYEGVPVNPESNIAQVFRAGHEAEEVVIDHMAVDGYRVVSRQKEIQLPITDKVKVVGHLDGMAIEWKTYDNHVLEIKSQNNDAWELFEKNGWDDGLFVKYKWQVSVYMHATTAPLLLVRWNRDRQEISYHQIDEPFYSLGEISTRVLGVEGLARTGAMPGGCDPVSFPCPYFYLHENPAVESDEEMDGLCEVYEKARMKKYSAEGEYAKARDALHSHVGGVGKKETDKFRVSVYVQKGPPRLDKEKLTSDGVDIDLYMTRVESERVRVTGKES